MFFDSWDGLLRVLIMAVLTYGALVLFIRITGKRTLSKLNAFDLVITVALGSTLASIILTKDVALMEGILALGLLIGLQFIVTWTSVRSGSFLKIIKAQPQLLYYEGRYLDAALKRERLTPQELMAVVRESGKGDMTSVRAIVLETDGSISIVSSLSNDKQAMRYVRKPDDIQW